MKKLFFILLVACVYGCNTDDDLNTSDPVFCTEEAIDGLKVTVKGPTDLFSIEGVTVTAKDGNYSENLENVFDSNVFSGATERAGTYIITVSKPGFQTFVSESPIVVEEDLCHVLTESVEVVLLED